LLHMTIRFLFMKNLAFCLYKFLHNKCRCLEHVFIVKIYFAIYIMDDDA